MSTVAIPNSPTAQAQLNREIFHSNCYRILSKCRNITIEKPKYHWKNEGNFEDGYLEAQVGDSPTVHFTVESEPPLAEDAQHTLTRDGKLHVTKRFIVKNNSIKFKKVRIEDSGIYAISCCNECGLVGKDTIELDVSSVDTTTLQSSHSELQ